MIYDKNMKPIESSADNLPKEVYYIVVNGSKQYYNTYEEAEKDLDYLQQYGDSNVGGVYTESDPEEIYELYEVGYIGNSRKPIKSSTAPDGLTFDSREDEDGYKFIQYKITDQSRLDKIKDYCDHNEDELQLGKTFLNLMYDESDKLLAAQLVDTDSSTWEVSPEECVEVFGSSIETLSDPSVGKHAVDEFMDYDVDPVQSARRTIKSGKKYNVIDKNGGVVGQPKSYEDVCDEAEEIGGTVKPVESSRKSVKSGLDFVQKGEVILAKKGTKVVGYIGQNADKSYYYGLGTPGKSSGVMVVSDFNSAAKRLEEQMK